MNVTVTLDTEGRVLIRPSVFTREEWETFLMRVNTYEFEYSKLLRADSPLPLADVLTDRFV